MTDTISYDLELQYRAMSGCGLIMTCYSNRELTVLYYSVLGDALISDVLECFAKVKDMKLAPFLCHNIMAVQW